MRRREFIAGLGATAAWPMPLRAQQGERVRRVGVLTVAGLDQGQKPRQPGGGAGARGAMVTDTIEAVEIFPPGRGSAVMEVPSR